MEILFPASMLIIGLITGALVVWTTNRPKLKHEYNRARAESETERATLAERLAGREQQLRELREALDRECLQSEGLRTENAEALAELSALTTLLDQERKSNQEKIIIIAFGVSISTPNKDRKKQLAVNQQKNDKYLFLGTRMEK